MKLNKLFHWLYASVMMLPLVVAPIFAVYSHRHQLTDNTNATVTYKYQSNEVNSIDDYVVGNVYHCDYLEFDFDVLQDYGNDLSFEIDFLKFDSLGSFHADDEYNDDILYGSFSADDTYFPLILDYQDSTPMLYTYVSFSSPNVNISYCYEFSSGYFFLRNCDFILSDGLLTYFDVCDNAGFPVQWWQESMPTKSDFNIIESVTFDKENNIMNLFINGYADTIDKYFNYDNVVNFGTLYTWLNTTFFSGAAPLGFFIFWHLLEYWLLTSLLWLLFDVLIYVPMLVHRWLDKASLS